jgi:hypothetical protein
LTEGQIEQYDPPPNPAKQTDSRFTEYRARYGDQSWELDALDPDVITTLITSKIEEFLDTDKWAESEARKDREKALLKKASDRWAELVRILDVAPVKPQLADSRKERCESCGSDDLAMRACVICIGTGKYEGTTCIACDGTTRIKVCLTCLTPVGEQTQGIITLYLQDCPKCGKLGHSQQVECGPCGGSGLDGTADGESQDLCDDCHGLGRVVVCNNCLWAFPLDAPEEETGAGD